MRRVPVLAAVPFLAAVAMAQAGNGLTVQPDPQHVVANSLVGVWQLDEPLNRRLGHRGGQPRLEFRADPAVLAKVPAKLAAKLKELRIYLAGTMVQAGVEHAFLVTALGGNPVVVWFRERGGDPLGDAETWNVSLVRAEAAQADLLFVGGDSNNQSFAAYARETKVVGALTAQAAMTEMLRLLEVGKKAEFVRTFAAPEDLAKLEQRGDSIEKLAGQMDEERVERITKALQYALAHEPEAGKDGELLSWQLPEELKIPRKLQLQRIDGRWYLRN